MFFCTWQQAQGSEISVLVTDRDLHLVVELGEGVEASGKIKVMW